MSKWRKFNDDNKNIAQWERFLQRMANGNLTHNILTV
jgi:hypothetical protein